MNLKKDHYLISTLVAHSHDMRGVLHLDISKESWVSALIILAYTNHKCEVNAFSYNEFLVP